MKEQLLCCFEEIKNKNLGKFTYDIHFKANQLCKLVRMQSIKDETIMEYFWVV